MARQSGEEIRGPLSPDNVIMKSSAMLGLCSQNFSLMELKILDVYLSRINSRDPSRRTVVFSKNDLEEIFGIGQLKTSTVKAVFKHMMSEVAEIGDPSRKNGINLIAIFETAKLMQQKDGICEVNLKCSESAATQIFNIENIGYLQYKLRMIAHLRSRHSYVLYLYLERNRYLGEWVAPYEALYRLIMYADETRGKKKAQDSLTAEIPLYKHFNQQVLKPAQMELAAQTDLRFHYEPVKDPKTKKTTGIHFVFDSVEDFPVDEPLVPTADMEVLD